MKVITLLILMTLLGAGCFNADEQILDDQQQVISDLQAEVNELVTQIDEMTDEEDVDEDVKSFPEVEAVVPVVIPESEASNTEDLDYILLSYKVDVQEFSDLVDQLLTMSENSPDGLCSSIVANQTTRSNLYYYLLEDVNNLESEYGGYRNSIEYINNNLAGQWGIVQILKDRCAAVGYSIE
jgi:hypothetical protein